MSESTITKVLADIERQKARISKERDRLRDLISELSSITDDCDIAVENLEDAADAMSRLL